MQADNNPAMGGGDEDLYSNGPGDETTAAEAKLEKSEEDGRDSEEAILPRSILAGKDFKVGDEVVLKITGLHDKEVSVTYAPEKPGEDEGGEDKAKVPAGMGSNDGNYD